MKLALVLVLLFGCHESDDIATLHDQAVALGVYYRPQLDALEKKFRDLNARGPMLGEKQLPGSDHAAELTKAAGNQLSDLQSIVNPGPHGKSELEAAADDLARQKDAIMLTRLIADTRVKLEKDTAEIRNELVTAERWLLEAEATVAKPAQQVAE